MGFTHPPLYVTGFYPDQQEWNHLKMATNTELLDSVIIQAIKHLEYIQGKYQDCKLGADLHIQLRALLIINNQKEVQP
jgi:hypothetical protein